MNHDVFEQRVLFDYVPALYGASVNYSGNSSCDECDVTSFYFNVSIYIYIVLMLYIFMLNY